MLKCDKEKRILFVNKRHLFYQASKGRLESIDTQERNENDELLFSTGRRPRNTNSPRRTGFPYPIFKN